MDPGVLILLGLLFAVCSVVCFQKGKNAFGWLGLAGIVPGLTPLGVFAVVGALRHAKPSSAWAKSRYGPSEMEIASRRYPQDVSAGQEDGSVRAGSSSTSDRKAEESISTEKFLVRRFLRGAWEAGIIDDRQYARLADYLQGLGRAEGGEVADLRPTGLQLSGRIEPSRTAAEEARRDDGVRGPEEPEGFKSVPSPAAELIPSVASPPAADSPIPAKEGPPDPSDQGTPPASRQVSLLWAHTWEAVASDVALHGFAYLGVILTFVGILGFLLFAFAELPDSVQPFVEAAIAFVFFGWAWMLRRQSADRVGDAMELIGGMVVPLIVFAGLVDGAPFPPDFTGGGLVAALAITSLVLAGLYWWISEKNRESTLRFLVAPLIWLAAMTLGFIFKTNEPLFSDAITRLVSPQPAMASVAVGFTLLLCLARPSHRLAVPTVRSALIGVPAAYLLTMSLSLGEDWELVWPVVVLGAATLTSVEVLALWFDRRSWMAVARPLLLAGVLGPLVPTVGLDWVALLVVVSYAILYELERRREPGFTVGSRLALAGIAVGLVMSLFEPWTSLATFTLVWAWSHVRRLDHDDRVSSRIFTAAAALSPIGVFYGLYGLWGIATALVIMAGLLFGLTLYVRLVAPGDSFWAVWLLAAVLITGLGAGARWHGLGLDGYRTAAALGLVAVSLGWGPRWPVWRTWLSAAAASMGLLVLLDEAGSSLEERQFIWVMAGLAVVAVANSWRNRPASHLAAIGHLIGTGALISLTAGGNAALALGGWAAGWVLTAIGDERGGDTLTSLLKRVVSRFDEFDSGVLGRLPLWVVPVFLTVSVPAAFVAFANRWDRFESNRSWTGALLVTVGVVYALVARSRAPREQLRRALGAGAVVLSVIGISVAAPDPWSTIYAAAGVLAAAALLSRDLRQSWFVWFAWSMTVVLALLLARQAGVPVESRHFASLAWGAVMMVGGLVLDDVRAGRRERGEGLRVDWLRYPVILGALVFPLSLGPTFTSGLETSAWWAIGGAVIYLAAAHLLRVGGVSAPAYALAAVGISGLWQRPITEDPWLFIFFAAPLVVLSWITERRQHENAVGWLRWDIAPLVVAHGVAGVALLFAGVRGGLASTALVFGILSVAVGLWKRGRVWEELGNLMMVLAAMDLGAGWLTLALGLTSVRGMVGVRLSTGRARISYQTLATAGAALGWAAYLAWSQLSVLDASGYSIVFFGAASITAAGLYRSNRVLRDTVLWWIGMATVAAGVTGVLAILPSGPGIRGAWFASGLLLLGSGMELASGREDLVLRTGSVATVGLAWAALVVGLGWGAPETYDYTALAFGGGAFVAAWLGRLDRVRQGNAIRWGGLGVAGVSVALLASGDGSGGVLFDGPEVAVGVALVAAAFELGWRFTDFGFRYASIGVTALSWAALAAGLGWDATTTAVWTSVVFGLGVVLVPELTRAMVSVDESSRSSLRFLGLIRAWAVLGAVGVAAGALLSYAGANLRVSGYWVAASLALLTVSSARGAAPFRVGSLREASPIAGLAAFITFAYTSDWSHGLVATSAVLLATTATLVTLVFWRKREGSPWVRPLIVLASLANLIAGVIAIALLPESSLIVGVLLSLGVQAIAVGLSRADPAILALGPPLLGGAFILSVSESISGSAQWYTVPIGVVLLSEVEIFRSLPGDRRAGTGPDLIMFLEWAGLGLLSAPPLIEMFTVSLFMGLAGVGVAVAVFVWGVATRVRRRVVSAAALVIATVVLMLFAAAAGTAPTSAFFWIVAIGVGFAVMSVAGFVEAYRSKKGRSMARLDVLMEGWE